MGFHKIKRLLLALIGVILLQSVLVLLHQGLPGYHKFREVTEDANVEMNALFYSEEGHTREAYLKVNEKLSTKHQTVQNDDTCLQD
jgi:hypothetical protein